MPRSPGKARSNVEIKKEAGQSLLWVFGRTSQPWGNDSGIHCESIASVQQGFGGVDKATHARKHRVYNSRFRMFIAAAAVTGANE